MSVNKYGLSRASLTASVKRTVRQRDGFGCVVCGSALIQYDHFEPEFAEAKEHNPDGIILLCTACHGEKTAGRLSRKTIEKALKDPKAKQKGFSWGAFDAGDEHPEIHIGSMTFQRVNSVLYINGIDVISIKPPEMHGGPFRINANLLNDNGEPLLKIVDNEWMTPVENWDVTVQGQVIKIWSAVRNVGLQLRTEPPNRLVFERVKMQYQMARIDFNERGIQEIWSGKASASFSGMKCVDCYAGIKILPGSISFGGGKDTGINPHLADFDPQSVSSLYISDPYLYALLALTHGLVGTLVRHSVGDKAEHISRFVFEIRQTGSPIAVKHLIAELDNVARDYDEICGRKLDNYQDGIAAVIALPDKGNIDFDIGSRSAGHAIAAMKGILRERYPQARG